MDVTKQIVISSCFEERIMAGRIFVLMRSVNGNGTKTISPFFICNSLLYHLLNKGLLLH